MRKKKALLVLVLVLVFIISMGSVKADFKKSLEEMGIEEVEVGLYATLINSFARGNLDDWFVEQHGDSTRLVDDGSPAFFQIEAAAYFHDLSDKMQLGAGLAYNKPAPRSLWGTALGWGGNYSIVLNPAIFTISAPIRFKLPELKFKMPETVPEAMREIVIIPKVSPALLVGWVSGYYVDFSNTRVDYSPAIGLGLGLSGGADVYITKNFGMSVKLGYRMLGTGLNASGGAADPVVAATGKNVTVSLSGLYFVWGLIAKF